MAPRRIYADALESGRVRAKKAREKAAAERRSFFESRTPKLVLSASEWVGYYRTEKAKAMERWAANGGPAPHVRGRHPICRGSLA